MIIQWGLLSTGAQADYVITLPISYTVGFAALCCAKQDANARSYANFIKKSSLNSITIRQPTAFPETYWFTVGY